MLEEKIRKYLLELIKDKGLEKIEIKINQITKLCYVIDKLSGNNVEPYYCFYARIEGIKENKRYIALVDGKINNEIEITNFYERWMSQ